MDSTSSVCPSGKQGPNRFQVLNHDQVHRLNQMLEDDLDLHSRCSDQPILELNLRMLIKLVREGLSRANVPVRDIRLNGGAASYVIGMNDDATFNDIDLLFGVDLSDSDTISTIRTVILSALAEFLPCAKLARPARDRGHSRSSSSSIVETPSPSPPSSPPPFPSPCHTSKPLPSRGLHSHFSTETSLAEAYIGKRVRVQTPWLDSWYLLGLGRHGPGRMSVELKFVDRMRRQFEFSVDSFQIILDSLLTFSDISTQPITEHFYPTVVAEAVSGSFSEALFHLKHKLISTRNPEEIRGGGLLRYCRLLVEGYLPAERVDIRGLERYMCSRFFIDFADLNSQRCRLLAYLDNHFVDNDELKVTYLETLRNVVAHSTVCLMGHERRQTLYLIDDLIQNVVVLIRARSSVVQLEEFNSDKWVLDQVFYGWSHFPQGYCPASTTVHSSLQTPDSGVYFAMGSGESSSRSPNYGSCATINSSSSCISSSSYSCD